MNKFVPALAAALFCVSTGFAFAQAPQGDAGKGPGMQNHEKMRENMKAAREACKDSPDKRGCMTQNFCAKQADPAKCQERAKSMHERMAKRMDQRQAAAEACTGKRGDELRKCYHEQHEKMHGGPERHEHDHDKKG